jgi:tryptophan synthase alpha chain
MNRLNELFQRTDPSKKILSLYLTAGFPSLESTVPLAKALAESGAELLEIGMPFSDPIADGPTIQRSNNTSLANGFTLEYLFDCLNELKKAINIPIVLMGHLNPLLSFGVDKYLKCCEEAEVSGSIIPDLPLIEYKRKYQTGFAEHHQGIIMLITSETSEQRIRELDEAANGFLYVVSSPSITGGNLKVTDERDAYFARLKSMHLKNPLIVGFGVDSRETFLAVTRHTAGAIIASAFLRELEDLTKPNDISEQIQVATNFVKKIKV